MAYIIDESIVKFYLDSIDSKSKEIRKDPTNQKAKDELALDAANLKHLKYPSIKSAKGREK